MNFLFGSSLDVGIELSDSEKRTNVVVKLEGDKTAKLPLFLGGDGCSGKVHLNLRGKKLNHQGVKIEFIGRIELFFDRGNDYLFISREQQLLPAGVLEKTLSIDFSFCDLELPHESYNGINVRLRYFLLVTVGQSVLDITKEKELWVHTYELAPESNPPIRMEVGVENALHIEFEFNQSKFHLNGIIVGKIYFLLIRLKIKFMELSILKIETSGAGANTYEDKDTVTKFEIMDGCPSRGETIPVRLFLNGIDVSPSMKDIHNKFSVKWFINIVLTDEEDRRYFKKQEFTLYRKEPRKKEITAQE